MRTITMSSVTGASLLGSEFGFDQSDLGSPPQCGQVFALGETVLPQALHGFIPSTIATQ